MFVKAQLSQDAIETDSGGFFHSEIVKQGVGQPAWGTSGDSQ
jgi:hypothetical protein